MKILKSALALFVGLNILLFATGCASNKLVATKAADDDATGTIEIVNNTGSTITELEVTRVSTTADITNNILQENWGNGERVSVNYTLSANTTILFKIGGETYAIHNAQISEVNNSIIKIKDDIPYLEYEKDGQVKDTLEYEKAYRYYLNQ